MEFKRFIRPTIAKIILAILLSIIFFILIGSFCSQQSAGHPCSWFIPQCNLDKSGYYLEEQINVRAIAPDCMISPSKVILLLVIIIIPSYLLSCIIVALYYRITAK